MHHYVEMMAQGKKLNDQGKYRYASEILDKLVFAQPQNQAAKDLLAGTTSAE